ncbi:MAG TPA: peptidylprolyl isomerase [Solirubrobacteraceae bacterium]|nr:peptidylprolyl isomerase [Solirubrobacteraceae bacterium]
MKLRRRTPALGAFFVAAALALGLAGCGSGGVPSGDVAVMAGNPISLRAVDHWMYVIAKGQAALSPGTPVIVPNDPPGFAKCIAQARAEIPSLKNTPAKQLRTDCSQLFKSLSSQAMDFLILSYWYQADAHRLGIHVTPAQVQAALAKAKRTQFSNQAQYLTYLKDSGQTQADILYRVLINQIYTRLTALHHRSVTPAAIAAYYQAHRSQFGTPEMRSMRIVLTKTAAQAQIAKAALERGQSWKVVARRYSIDPTTKNDGGLLSNVTAAQEDKALSTAAFAAPVGRLLGPIKGQFGYYVVEVTHITAATQQTLAQATPQIRATLQTQYANAAAAAVDAHARRDWLSRTRCAPAYAMADCSGYRAPKASSSASG